MDDSLAAEYTKSHKNHSVILILALIIFTSILFTTSLALAVVDITLAWDASAGATEYHVYSREAGQSYNYNSPDCVSSTTSCTVTNLNSNTIYYFVARAFDGQSESGNSNEEKSPTISRSPVSLSPASTEGNNASSQTFDVWNSGGGTLNYTISDNASWLSCSPSSGSSTGGQNAITVTYNTSGLTAGSYSATINTTDTVGSSPPQTISVSLTVNPVSVPPSITLGSSSIFNSVTEGSNASSQTFTVQNTGGGTLSYTISDNRSWLSISPSSGTSTGEQDTITVNYSTSGLVAGTYSGTITVTDANATNSPQTISVNVTVNPQPSIISVNTGSLSPACTEGSDASSQTFRIWNLGGGTLSYSISDNRNWLSVSPSSGTSTGEQDTITVTYSTSGLTAGTYSGTITITDANAGNSPQTISVSLNVAASNAAPGKPVIISPFDGELECDPLIRVTADPFSDSDVGDFHSKSLWSIIKKQDSSIVLEIASTEHLTTLPVPHTVLDRDTTYLVSVQFYDAYSAPSGWSDPIEFTTTQNIVDFDGDGIPDGQEVDDTVDLNADGIPDNNQPGEIKCVESAVAGNVAIGVSPLTAPVDSIEVIEPINPVEILDKANKPATFLFGLFSYRLRLNQIGDTVLVTIYFSNDISNANRFYIYDTINGWQDYTQHTTFNGDGRSITVELQDGGHGDSDGVANGVIVDPGGVVASSALGVISGADSGAGGGCFIATAAFGSYLEPRVMLLKEFRDRYLLTNSPGKRFVKAYYQYGPHAANHVEEHDWLKPIVRVLLMPLVGISYILVRTSLAGIVLMSFLLVISILSWYSMIYRNRNHQR